MKYNSLNEIRSEFNFQTDQLSEIDKALKKIQVDLVPKGDDVKFKNDDDEIRYNKAIAAREFIKGLKKQKALTKVQSNDLIVNFIREMVPNQQKQMLVETLDRKAQYALETYHSAGRSIKFTSGGIFAFLTILFLSPKTISEHPLLKDLFNPASTIFFMLWLSSLFYTFMFWNVVYRREQRAKRRIQMLKNESFQNELLESFAYEKTSFVKDDLSRFILNGSDHRRSLLNLFTAPVIDLDITDSVADLIIEKALSQHMIELVPSRTLSRKYNILFTPKKSMDNEDEIASHKDV